MSSDITCMRRSCYGCMSSFKYVLVRAWDIQRVTVRNEDIAIAGKQSM